MDDPRLAEALSQLQLAYGLMMLPNWQQHAAAIPAAVHGLTQFFLHVDATTGEHHEAPIYLEQDRVVYGLLPAAVAPLVRLLQRQTLRLDAALAQGFSMPDTEAPAWAHWHDRLAAYVDVLEQELAAAPLAPSERLWREVTAPLLQGNYPAHFGELGIVNPAVPSKSDVTTVPTTAFMVALQTQEVSGLQDWLLAWRGDLTSWLDETKQALARVAKSLGKKLESGLRKFAVVPPLLLALWLAWVVGQNAERNRQFRNNPPRRGKN